MIERWGKTGSYIVFDKSSKMLEINSSGSKRINFELFLCEGI